MNKAKLLLKTSVAIAVATGAQTVNAQAVSFHADVDGGVSSFHSEGLSKSKIGWGGSAGADADLGGFFVGGEGSFWWAPAENRGVDPAGNHFVNHKTFQEWALGLRAGASLAPGTKVYGKVAYVTNEQRKEICLTAAPCRGGAAVYHHFNTHGIQYGVGAEQMIMNNFYVKAEGRYSDYKNHTHTLTGLIGVGVAFGGPAPAPVVVAPPPPAPVVEAPATQTCPDGSVILATSTCPVPPPPPPPPAPVQRGQRG